VLAKWRVFLLILVPLLLLSGLMLTAVCRAVWRSARNVRKNPRRWSFGSRIAFALGVAALLIWIFVPAVKWYHTVVVLGVIDSAYSRIARYMTRGEMQHPTEG
jgi:hypothetical protein